MRTPICWSRSIALLVALTTSRALSQVDPGVRGGPPGAGAPLPNLNEVETQFFDVARETFEEVTSVKGTIPDEPGRGLGPRYNGNSCAVCHQQPATGGTSPSVNPSVALATLDGARNAVPWFIAPSGPVREARFKRKPDGTHDGGVANLFTIAGRADALWCGLTQPDFGPPGDPLTGQGGNPNLIFRIPTPVFGAGLIEAIPDSTILANMRSSAPYKAQLGIYGRPNVSGNDGTITRFGWKAQNNSLSVFAGEAYNVELGVTNMLFPHERDDSDAVCLYNRLPEDHANLDAQSPADVLSDMEQFVIFMRLLAPPTPAPETPVIASGRALFASTGCALCHTPTLKTGAAASLLAGEVASAALSGQDANLYSDLLLHAMGVKLADGIPQGAAGPDEFRTAPLWGLGQRIFLLHDGRTTDLVKAIAAHASTGSEANAVIRRFEELTPEQKQAVLVFLRSL